MKRQVRDTLLGFDGSRKHTSILFASLREVVQCISSEDDAPARDAAVGFLSTVLLAPEASHYTALATEPGASLAHIKDHYRLLVRVVHPDFAAAGGAVDWPEGAAARLNQAYEILSDPQARARYDADLSGKRRAARAPSAAGAHAHRQHGSPRTVLKALATSFGLLGAGGLAFLYWMGGRDDPEQLVQREPATVIAMASPAATDEAKQSALVDTHMDVPAAVAEAPLQAASADAPGGALARLSRGLDITLAGLAPSAAAQSTAPPGVVALEPETQRALSAARPPEMAAMAIAANAPASAATPAPASSSQPAAAAAAMAPAPVSASTSAAPAPPAAAPREAASRQEPTPKEAAIADGTPTVRDAQLYIVRLLEQLEAGHPERVLGLIDGDGRDSPAANAFVRQYSALVRSGRPARMLGLQLRSSAAKGRLLVKGRISLEFQDEQNGVVQSEFPIEAVFERRGDAVVLTALGTGT
jgi:hypothetical protein